MEINYTFYFFAFLRKMIKKLLTFCYWGDELVFYDITASSDGRKLFTDILCETAKSVFIPLTVGGCEKSGKGAYLFLEPFEK